MSYPIVTKLSQNAPGMSTTDWRSYRPFQVLKYRLVENRDFWPIVIFELDEPLRWQVAEISVNSIICQNRGIDTVKFYNPSDILGILYRLQCVHIRGKVFWNPKLCTLVTQTKR